jgi:hypothetical protein
MYVLIAFESSEQARLITSLHSDKLIPYSQSPYRHDDDPNGIYEYFVYCRACRHIQIVHNKASVRKATNGCCAWNKLQIPVRKQFTKTATMMARTAAAVAAAATITTTSATLPSTPSTTTTATLPLSSSSEASGTQAPSASMAPVPVPSVTLSPSQSSDLVSSSSSSSLSSSSQSCWTMEPTVVYSSTVAANNGIPLTIVTRVGEAMINRLAERSLYLTVAGTTTRWIANDYAVACHISPSFFTPSSLQYIWQLIMKLASQGDTRPRLMVSPGQIQCVIHLWDANDSSFPSFEGILTYIIDDDNNDDGKSPSTPSTPGSSAGIPPLHSFSFFLY